MISKDELVQLIHPNIDLTGKPKLQEAYRLCRSLIYKGMAEHVLDSSLTAYFERFTHGLPEFDISVNELVNICIVKRYIKKQWDYIAAPLEHYLNDYGKDISKSDLRLITLKIMQDLDTWSADSMQDPVKAKFVQHVVAILKENGYQLPKDYYYTINYPVAGNACEALISVHVN